jgi:GT2 family glycosyltransferase
MNGRQPMPAFTDSPILTVAVIHRHWRGYPARTLESLDAPAGTEYLLVTGTEDGGTRGPAAEIGGRSVRVIEVSGGDRATAKNAALREARGECLLLVSSEMVAAPGAVAALLEFLQGHEDVAASALMLNENGLARRTTFAFPSPAREMNPVGWLWRRRHQFVRMSPPERRRPYAAAAVRAQFLMARRETFLRVGEFTEGYRFSAEDLDWCARARQAGVARRVVPEARAYNLAPQLHGEVPPAHRVAMEDSLCRLATAMNGPASGAAFRAVRRAKTLVKWGAAALWNRAVPAHSNLLTSSEAVHRALWRMEAPGGALPPDAESHSRWEASI